MSAVGKHRGVPVGRNELHQRFNDTDAEVLWLIIGAAGGTGNSEGLESQNGFVADLFDRSEAGAEGNWPAVRPPKA